MNNVLGDLLVGRFSRRLLSIDRDGLNLLGFSSLPVCLTLFCLFWWKWWCLYFVVFFSCDDFMGGDLISVFFLVLVHFASRA